MGAGGDPGRTATPPSSRLARAAALAVLLLLAPASLAGADLGDVDTALAEVSFDEVQVSLEGARLAFLTRSNDFASDREVFALWVLELSAEAGAASSPVRLAEGGNYSSLRWSPDGRVLSFLSAADPEEALQLFVLEPVAGAVPRRMTSADRFPSGVDLYGWLPDGAGFIAVAADPPAALPAEVALARQELYGDVRRRAGEVPAHSLHRVGRGDGRSERLADVPFEAPFLLAVSPDGSRVAVAGSALSESVESSEVAVLPLVGAAQAGPPPRTRNWGWEESLAWVGQDLFATIFGEEQDGRYTATEGRLFRLDGGELRAVAVAPGLPGYVKQQVPLADGSILVTASVSTHMRLSRVDPRSGRAETLLDQPGWIANLTASRDGRVVAFVASDSRHFPEIHLARGVDRIVEARAVTAFNRALTHGPLPEIETVSWDDGEGSTVEGVLYWPPGRKGAKGLPLVVDLHGGPFSVARTEAVSLEGSSLSFPAVLAARGFLVLNPNYRGSAGRGDAFARGIEGRRCSRPSEDVIRGVESLIARGWADRERLGLMGYSAGGGLSRCLLGRTEMFRAVATGSGVWNDILLYGSTRGRMWSEVFFLGTSPWERFDLWWRESPMSGLERIATPTLILAGGEDGDAPRHADELYRSLVARGVPVEYLVFPGEGHVFMRPSHKRTQMRAQISWLEHHLLGKPRPEQP